MGIAQRVNRQYSVFPMVTPKITNFASFQLYWQVHMDHRQTRYGLLSHCAIRQCQIHTEHGNKSIKKDFVQPHITNCFWQITWQIWPDSTCGVLPSKMEFVKWHPVPPAALTLFVWLPSPPPSPSSSSALQNNINNKQRAGQPLLFDEPVCHWLSTLTAGSFSRPAATV